MINIILAIAKKIHILCHAYTAAEEKDSGHDIACHIRWVHYGVDEEDRRGGGD